MPPKKQKIAPEKDETTKTKHSKDGKEMKVKKENLQKTKNYLKEETKIYPYPERFQFNKFFGFHTSISGGLYKAIEEAETSGALSFACFLKSQRSWKSRELNEKTISEFKKKLQMSWIKPEMILPHGSYLMNLGSSEKNLCQKSRNCLLDEVKRCQMLSLLYYNFHPGSWKGGTLDESIDLIAENINWVLQQTSSVTLLIENMCCQGNTVGGDFRELRMIIDKVKDKGRVGVCLDTCHAFAAGYDLKTPEEYENVKKLLDETIDHQYIKAVHLNDSKGELGCHLDRHENIGKGKLGIEFFRRFAKDPFFNNIPIILETPDCDYKQEIDLLYSLALN